MPLLAPLKLEFRSAFVLQQFGRYDPSAVVVAGRLVKVFMTEQGPCRVELCTAGDGVLLTVSGAQVPEVEAQLRQGLEHDAGAQGYVPVHPLLQKLHRRQPGLRLVRVPWLFDVACSAVLQQRVTTLEAMKQWRMMANALGTRTPDGLVAFPSADVLAKTPSFTLQAMGIDIKRTRTLLLLARELRLHPLRGQHSYAQLRARLARVRGIGPWTSEMILGFGAADPDAVPTGDLHLPHLVSQALAQEPRGSDARMLELLEPERGHRFRAIRLLFGARLR